MTDLPFQSEYAKSGRAACKGCKEKIGQGTLRIAVMVQSAFHDGKQPNWFHKDCFFKKQRPTNVNNIANFNKLRLEDQNSIKESIESLTGIVLPVEKGKKGKKGKRGNAESNLSAAIKDFCVEYSKSSRATCKVCDIKICKGEVRISKTVYDTEIGMKYGGQPLWHHVKCFAEARNDLLYMAGGEDLPGFKLLKKEDQKMVKDEIKSMSLSEVPVKKLKSEPKDEVELKEEKAKEESYEKQNKLFFKHRDALAGCSKSELSELLEVNKQQVPSGMDEILDRVADMMAFGALKPCPECKHGQFVLDNFGYKCTGDVSEWTKCIKVTQEPKRVAMKVPKEFKKSSAFTGYKPKVDARLFRAAPPPATVVVKKETGDIVKKEKPVPPLKNLEFFLYGRLKGNKENIKHRILKLGGKVVSKITDTVAAVISTQEEVEKMSSKMEQIKADNIEVVEESYLDLISSTGTVAESLELITKSNIADWGNGPSNRVPQDVIDGKSMPKSKSIYHAKSGVTQLKVKGGTAVDPASELDDQAHVYCEGDNKYTVVLGRTDIVDQKNSYYKLQVLEADVGNRYWLFRSWGRIGTTIGGNKVEQCSGLDEAIYKFEELYMEKTDNPWEFRSNFKKVPGRYCPIEMDYGDSEPQAELQVDSRSKLPMPVQKIIAKIFDIKMMKKTLLEFELDTDKMPLGKLSKKQIKAGYKVLTELNKLIDEGKTNQNKLIDATNRFYTLIPHNFGIENPPVLNDVELIKTKILMLDSLLEIEIAYNLLNTDNDDKDAIPIDSHYLKLKADIAPLDKKSTEYQMIIKYMKNTHAATHSNYSLEIDQLFKVIREGEEKRYKPFKKLHNRRLLWHGSRTSNFAGILSQGLRIAPPEAPVTGYMFGKGIYFADMVSKSANYCCTSTSDPVGLLLLCEVALGDMKECLHSEYIEKLPKGVHSTWGVGRTMPDPAQDQRLECGTVVPLGTPVVSKKNTALLYNEFIVYDIAQVNVKYLVQTKFKYNY